MPSSTAPEAKRRILAALQARPNLAQVAVTWAPPGENEDIPQGGELVYLGDVELEGFWRVLGGTRRDEQYTISLYVFVQQYGDDPQATEERAWALLDEVSAAINTDSSLGGLLWGGGAEITAATQRVGAVSPTQTGCRIDATVSCHAQFTP